MHPGYQQNITYGLKRYLKDTWKIDHVDMHSLRYGIYSILRQSSRVMKCKAVATDLKRKGIADHHPRFLKTILSN